MASGKRTHDIARSVHERSLVRSPLDQALRSLGNGRLLEKLRHHRYPRRARHYDLKEFS